MIGDRGQKGPKIWLFLDKIRHFWAYFAKYVVLEERVDHDIELSSAKSRG
jgi:hypothetical protein